jgi:hypothetical protein
MQRSSESIACLAAALAKAQAELTNPEKSLVATLKPNGPGDGERSFRCAPLSSGLDIARKTLGQHENVTQQIEGAFSGRAGNTDDSSGQRPTGSARRNSPSCGGLSGRKQSVIRSRFLLHLGRQFNHSPNCFGTRWKVGLSAPPVVYSAQKVL